MREKYIRSMRGIGMSEEAIQQQLAKEDAKREQDGGTSDDFTLWPENATAWELWQVVCDDWRVGGMGGVLGLDWACVESEMNMLGTKNRRERFLDLKAMDRAARPILNARDKP